jgi:hypothetical protein
MRAWFVEPMLAAQSHAGHEVELATDAQSHAGHEVELMIFAQSTRDVNATFDVELDSCPRSRAAPHLLPVVRILCSETNKNFVAARCEAQGLWAVAQARLAVELGSGHATVHQPRPRGFC